MTTPESNKAIQTIADSVERIANGVDIAQATLTKIGKLAEKLAADMSQAAKDPAWVSKFISYATVGMRMARATASADVTEMHYHNPGEPCNSACVTPN